MPGILILDTETKGLRPELGETAFAAATSWLEDPQKRVTVYRLDQSDDVAGLTAEIERADGLIGHHLVFDLRQLIRTFKWPETAFDRHRLYDTRIRATYAWPARYFTRYSADSKGKPFALKTLTADARGIPGDEKALKQWLKDRVVSLYGKNRRKWDPWMKAQLTDYSLVPDDMLAPYLIGDIVRTRLLWERCEFHLSVAGQGTRDSLALDEALLHPILRMELRGLPCSLEELETQVAAMKNQLKVLRGEIGWDYRIHDEMVRRWGDLAARFGFFTKKPSKTTGLRRLRFDVHALTRFAREGAPEAEKVLKARAFEKRLSSYGKVWDPWARRLGRLHCYLNVEGTHTGRFSCNGPNLQTMPRGKDGLRRCIVPEPGCVMICADWCVDPSTPLLRADMSWAPASSIAVGDELIGFDEESSVNRRLRRSTVTNVRRLEKQCYMIRTDRGDVISSYDHLWAVGTQGQYKKDKGWRRTDKFKPGDEIKYFVGPWREKNKHWGLEKDYDKGWMAGLLDGEGCLSNRGVLTISQNPGPVLDKAVRLLTEWGIEHGVYPHGDEQCRQIVIRSRADAIRLLIEVRPERLLRKAAVLWEGCHPFCTKGGAIAKVLDVIPYGVQSVVAIETTTRTFIANGLLSHNCAMEFVGAAHCASDAVLLQDCLTGDVHTRTAEMLFGTLAPPGTDRFKMQRGCGKTFNLATLYGAQEHKLRLGLEKETGEAWPIPRLVKPLDYLRGRYANLNQWRMTTQQQAEKGISQSDPWGRRYLPQRRREFAIINAIVQGFCAGVMKRAVMRAWQNGLDLRMVIHDELIFMVPKDDVVRMVRIIGDMMKVIEGFEFPVEVLAAHENYAAKRALEAPKGE